MLNCLNNAAATMKRTGLIPIFGALAMIFLTTTMPSAQAGVTCGVIMPGSTVVNDSEGFPFACIKIINDGGDSPPFLRTDNIKVDICSLTRPFDLVNDGPFGDAIITDPSSSVFPLDPSGGYPVAFDPYDCKSFPGSDFIGFEPPMEQGNHVFQGEAMLEGRDGQAWTFQLITGQFNTNFLVLPESPIGVIAIMAASLGALGAFYALRRNNNRLPGP